MVELDEKKAYRDWAIRFTSDGDSQPLEGIGLLSYNQAAGDLAYPSLEQGFKYLLDRDHAHVSLDGVPSTSAIQWDQYSDVPFQPDSTVPQYTNRTLHAVMLFAGLSVWILAEQPLSTIRLETAKPILFEVVEDGKKPDAPLTPWTEVAYNAVTDIIIQNPEAPSHPIHLHGHRFFIVAFGNGSFPYDTLAEAKAAGVPVNLVNPPLRDSFEVLANAWTVIRFVDDNPG
jgi:Multicopper oxidase